MNVATTQGPQADADWVVITPGQSSSWTRPVPSAWPGSHATPYARAGDPHQVWESVYGIATRILAPVRQHIRDDVLGGHASLFRQVALDAAPHALPLETALSALASARAVFDATRLWQRDICEHYQLGGGSPAKAAL
jgi:hypothetical protein